MINSCYKKDIYPIDKDPGDKGSKNGKAGKRHNN